jgi:predicted nucleic acid-binding protein
MSPIFNAPTICNAGPLIGLARVHLAWLPFRLFPQVIVPEEVRQELLSRESPDHSQLEKVMESAHVHPSLGSPDPLLQAELDSGEAAVIAVALHLGLSSVILDEKKARRIAAHAYGLTVKGTAGLLVEAKSRGLIEKVEPHLDGMIRGGYFLGPKLVASCLMAAGEA